MRVIPVIDLQARRRGARRPRRARTLSPAAEPDRLRVRARWPWRARCASGSASSELYVADLDAIAGGAGSPDVVAALAREARVMVDAGAADAPGGRAAARARRRPRRDRHGVAARRGRVPAAPGRAAGGAAGAQPRPPRRARALARPGGWRGGDAADALARLADAGAREAIVLDLARRRLRRGTGRHADRRAARPLPGGPPARRRRRARRRRPPRARRRPERRGPWSRPRCTAARSRPTSCAGSRERAARSGGSVAGRAPGSGPRGRAAQAPRSRCSTSAAATSTPVACSTPRQPGMPLTSST